MSTPRWSRRGGRQTAGSLARSGRCRPQHRTATVLYSRPDPGNAAELTLVGASLERLLEISGPGSSDRVRLRDGAAQDDARDRTTRACGSWCRCARARDSANGSSPRSATTGCVLSATCPSARPSSPPSCALGSGARCATGRSRALTPQPPLTLRVAYIHSSEEATQVADARERALVKAEDALERAPQRIGWPLLQDPRTGATTDRSDPRRQHHRPDQCHGHHPATTS